MIGYGCLQAVICRCKKYNLIYNKLIFNLYSPFIYTNGDKQGTKFWQNNTKKRKDNSDFESIIPRNNLLAKRKRTFFYLCLFVLITQYLYVAINPEIRTMTVWNTVYLRQGFLRFSLVSYIFKKGLNQTSSSFIMTDISE